MIFAMLNTGTVLQNRYQILEHLGGGGMGDVYLASDARLDNTRVVIKENREGDWQLFKREATILAALQHSNLPHVMDYFIEADGKQYLVMQYIAGENLAKMAQRRGMLPESEALPYFAQVCSAVDYLHENHIIHRDIKPENVIVTPQAKAVLVDFGIAKIKTGSGSSTGGIGSPNYASPEHYTGGTDERSDVYTLGCTLYYLLTGIDPPMVPQRAGGENLISLRARNATVSEQTERAVYTAMAMPREQRFPSVRAFSNAVFARPAPPVPPVVVLPPPPPPIPTPVAPPKTPWGWIGGIGAGALFVVAFAVCLLAGIPPILLEPTKTSTATQTVTIFEPTRTPSPVTVTPTTIHTWTLTPTLTSAASRTASLTPSFTPTGTWTPTGTATFTRTHSPTPSRTFTATRTRTPTFIPTATPVPPTPVPTATERPVPPTKAPTEPPPPPTDRPTDAPPTDRPTKTPRPTRVPTA